MDIREPIKVKWIWPVLIAIILLGVPWYFPQGAVEPIILGFPLWAFVSLVMSVVLSLFLYYVVTNHWRMENPSGQAPEGRKAGGESK
ncbi:MAG TPA: hypothetical protein GXX23_00065 [Firmicutes bacterium]|nr:hypothetical protein [Candidatus Fermentithermobacillaceae bacterium]